ncbi:MAG: hypothetical protein JO253_08045 [Alphaproteobacteria bacterium]|nr:hypothetical protein [Alphaproteobacteria bacterium]
MTYDQVRHEIDFPRLEALNRYWQYSPPVHISVALYFGLKKPVKVKAQDMAQSLMAFIDGGQSG